MDIISYRDVADRAARLIASLLKKIDQGDASFAARERLERAVRLWSEADGRPAGRCAWLKSGDAPEAASLDAVILDGAEMPADVSAARVYRLDAPDAAPSPRRTFDRLPEREAPMALFDAAGRFREDVRALGVEALKANRTACVLMAGGAATRYADSVDALRRALDNGDLTDEQRRTVELFRETGVDARACMDQSKLFAPLTCVTGKSAFQINVESVAQMSALSGFDMPLIVFVSEGTRAGVEQILREHDCFGLKNVVVADQDNAPVIREDSYEQAVGPEGPVRGANGGGGIVYSLGHCRPVGPDGRALHDGSILDWLGALDVRRVIFSQTDDAKSAELYIGLAAAASRSDSAYGAMAAMTSLYPTQLIGGDPLTPAFKLGSIWADGAGGCACTEFAELTDDQRRMLTDPDNVGRALANTALYLFDTRLIRRVVDEGGLKIHLQRHKRVRDRDGAFVPTTKFEYFLPDMLEQAASCGAPCHLAILRDTTGLQAPLTDMTVDALPAKDIGKLALSRLARLYCDKALLRAAGLNVEDGALVEVGPFASVTAEPGAVIRRGARVYIGGTAEAPVTVRFAAGAAVEGERRFTASETVTG